MAIHSRLGDYLRARRALVNPADVGFPVGEERRRVAGLRREEVAILAGISTDYYLRLEQGRDLHPSAQVLDALARALQLDAAATTYLHRLAQPPRAPEPADRVDVVDPSTRALIDSWPLTAAVVHNRYIDVLASNELARALNPNFRPGVNSVLSLLLDDSERDFHDDWKGLARGRWPGCDTPRIRIRETSGSTPWSRRAPRTVSISPVLGVPRRGAHPRRSARVATSASRANSCSITSGFRLRAPMVSRSSPTSRTRERRAKARLKELATAS